MHSSAECWYRSAGLATADLTQDDKAGLLLQKVPRGHTWLRLSICIFIRSLSAFVMHLASCRNNGGVSETHVDREILFFANQAVCCATQHFLNLKAVLVSVKTTYGAPSAADWDRGRLPEIEGATCTPLLCLLLCRLSTNTA